MSNGEEAPLLSDGGSGGGYGSNGKDYPSAEGYRLNPNGLANVVSQSQLGALEAFGGLSGLASAIGCEDSRSGLSSDKLSAQRDAYGSNRTPPPEVPSLLSLYWDGLKDPTIIMLLCSSVVSLVLGLGIERDFEHGWIEGTSISVTVLLVVSVAALTDYAKAKAFRDQLVKLESEKSVTVVRNGGEMKQIHPRDLVVGDVMLLAVGDIAAVDGVLLEGSSSDLKMDESALTGETNLIAKSVYRGDSKKKEVDPFIISGTNVMLGSGKMLVLAVGDNSIQGKILARIREDGEDDDVDEVATNTTCLGKVKGFFSFGSLTGQTEGADLMGKLDVLAMDIGKVGLIVAFLVFLVLLVSWIQMQIVLGSECSAAEDEISCLDDEHCEWGGAECSRPPFSAEDLSVVLDFFITAVTILVVAVPEGLPLAVTLALAISIQRMMTDNNQVKHMDSCETMGSATTICSDKTGTLTENRMTTTRTRCAGADYEYVVGKSGSFENLGQVILGKNGQSTKTPLSDLLAESMLLNCAPTSKVFLEADGQARYEGNATECALIKLAKHMGYEPDEVRSPYKHDGGNLDWGVFAFPFSSEYKRMSWIVQRQGSGKPYRMYSKGAPQQLFDICDKYVAAVNGETKVKKMGGDEQLEFEEKVNEYQKQALRSLAIAYKDFDAEPSEGWGKIAFEGLTLLAVVGIEDPLRPTVPGAIADCHKAGIDVRMCTGDALATGVAIAKGCGILRKSDLGEDGEPKPNFAMTGAEFDDRVHRKDPDKPKAVRRVFDPDINDSVDRLAEPFLRDDDGNKVIDQEAFDSIWPTLRVLARCQPEDKLTLVRGMRKSKVFKDEIACAKLKQQHGINIFPDYQVVAVTGDGTNDAPALKSANVGFAMGIVGTETAKQACDIILLDDNFASIVKAVQWGRNVFDSISKFLQFQLTVNVVAITLATVGAFTYAESPLTAVQMLWINMIMDSLASLALATELPTPELLERPPYGRRRPVISPIMTTNILGHSFYQIVMLFWVLFAPQTIPGLSIEFEPHQGSHHWSLFFNVFVMLQLFNEFNSRRLVTAEKLRTSLDEWNVFSGVLSNWIFVAIMVSTFAIQVFIMQFGGAAINLNKGGLDVDEWIFSVAVGAGGLVWQVILNAGMALCVPKESEEETVETKPLETLQQEAAKQEDDDHVSGTENWRRLRYGIRQGHLYADMFHVSFRSGHKLHSLVKTSMKERQMERRSSESVRSIRLRRPIDDAKTKKNS